MIVSVPVPLLVMETLVMSPVVQSAFEAVVSMALMLTSAVPPTSTVAVASSALRIVEEDRAVPGTVADNERLGRLDVHIEQVI